MNMNKMKHFIQPTFRRMLKYCFLSIAGFLLIQRAQANNLQITGFSVDQGNSTVTFTLSWNNSFRDAVNWDAAWVFVKFRDCNALPTTVEFTHGLLSATLTDHTIASVFEATNSSGTAGVMDASPDNTGIMLRRSADGNGTVSGTITLKITNLPAAGTFDVRIFGIEMVFIPSGTYLLGDGNNGTPSSCSFSSSAGCGSNCTAMTISSEAAITVNYTSTFCPTSPTSSALLAGFPKGFAAFYIMKYEISQGQYADFLNALNNSQAANRFPGQNGNNRHTISGGGIAPNVYSASRPDRACNWLSWTDVAAYLDWAALRPLTEMQYEKAARGFGSATQYEKSWGSPTGVVTANYIFGPEDGTETIGNAGANINSSGGGFSGTGDGGTGPLRAGIYATSSTTTRLQTGSGYFGVMELSGNVYEFYATSICGIAAQPCANGITFGDGSLSTSGVQGEANNTTWPVSASNGDAVQNVILRGGSWSEACANNSNQQCNISHRSAGTFTTNTENRDNRYGGRGGR